MSSPKEKEIAKKEKRWQREKEVRRREYELRKEKQDLKNSYTSDKKISTSKLLIFFLFISCSIIEIFTGWVTIKCLTLAIALGTYPDFSPLVTLIGAVVGEVVGFAIYAIKSAKENSAGGIIFETTMASLNDMQMMDDPGNI